MPDRVPEDMPDRMLEDMPDRMPEDMSDRLPEDLPVTKFIIVGITRSKVIFLFFFEKRNGFGVSLEILQTLSILTPNSNDFILVLCFVLYCFIIFVWKRRTTLE